MKRLLIIICALGLGACMKRDATTATSFSAPTTAFETGYWRMECMPLGNGNSARISQTYSNGNYEIDTWYFADESCKIYGYKTIEQGTYSIPSTGTNTNLNLTTASVTMIMEASFAVGDWNDQGVCGKEDWVLFQPVNVAGAGCGGITYPDVGDTRYNIFNIASGSQGSRIYGDLYFGLRDENHNGNSPANRPTDLDDSLTFRHYR